ncbi:MAG: tetratricopeptide repeat protein [Paracoccaceae bacterium]
MDQMSQFISDHGTLLGTIAAVIAIVEFVFKPFRLLLARWKKPDTVALDDKTVAAIAGERDKDGPKLTVPEFIRMRREFKAELEAELAQTTGQETEILRARITELERQIANPDAALAEAKARIVELEELLERSGNEIGGDRIAEARAALEQGDYSIADGIFAEIEARSEMAVKRAARAAFGRGEIAEAEVRWHDAAKHYSRAAELNPTYDTLLRAGIFLHHSGDYAASTKIGERLLKFSRQEFGETHQKTTTAINNLAASCRAQGRADKAELLYREALKNSRETIGIEHPAYATRLNNLAGLLRETGRYDEAEPLYREALKISRETVGVEHSAYATRLNNLAVLLNETGRYDEAEPLYREALEIGRKTLGIEHPEYAIRLSNLALLFRMTGRYDEAEPLYREALEVGLKTIGVKHPDYAARLNNLAGLLRATGRYEDAERLFREALAISEKALGAEHPQTKTVQKNLQTLLDEGEG